MAHGRPREFRYLRPLLPGMLAVLAVLVLERVEDKMCEWVPAGTLCEALGPWWLPLVLIGVALLSVVLSIFYYWRDFHRVKPPPDWEDTHWRHD